MTLRLLPVVFAIVALAAFAGKSHAQYVYLDANGDGIWSFADVLGPNGTPTTVDAWINTNHYRDGSLAVCNTGDGNLGFWNSYVVNLHAVGGTVTFTSFVNQQTNFTLACVGVGVDFLANNTEMTACRATPNSEAAGLKRMFTVTITGQTGAPRIEVIRLGSLSPNFTSFGTPCSGLDFDNTYKLGSDFLDNDGLRAFSGPDRAPIVTAPIAAGFVPNNPGTVVVTATDPDADAITSLTQVSTPATMGSTFTAGAGNASGTFSWTPSLAQTGSYTLTFTASNVLSGTAATNLSVAIGDQPPVVVAPSTVTGAETTAIAFTVSAADPDGSISSLTATSGPATPGSTFSVNVSRTSGTWAWTPSFAQSGTYNVTFTASNTQSGTAVTTVTVTNIDRAPEVAAPATVSLNETMNVTFTVTVSDPDGEAISSWTAASSPPTTGSVFTVNAAKTLATFSWTPTFTQAGMYNVTFTASNAASGSAMTTITVNDKNQNPVISAPGTQSTDESVLLSFGVSAMDPDGSHVTLRAIGSPPGSGFTDHGDDSGTFSWTPGFFSANTYIVTFRGDDGHGGLGDAATAITVRNVDRPPLASAGGPYIGVTDIGMQLNGSGSSDPDGGALSYAWDFGDGSTGSGTNPVHTYVTAGLYTVTLTVSSGLSDTDATTATISDKLPSRIFAVGGNSKTSLGAGKPYTTFQIEPVGGSYGNGNAILSTIRMIYPPGSPNQISVDASKSGVDADKDGNGIGEIAAAFRKEDMRVLFTDLPAGNNIVTVEIKGDLVGGGSFGGTIQHTVKSSGGTFAASILPNPLNPRANLSFTTTKPGAVRVQMFDPQGRLVKTIADELVAMAGYHDYTIDGRSAAGSKLASGVYFVKVWSEHDGDEVKRIAILK